VQAPLWCASYLRSATPPLPSPPEIIFRLQCDDTAVVVETGSVLQSTTLATCDDTKTACHLSAINLYGMRREIPKAVANMLNKQWRIADKGWS
jgi:hypothetical protein